MGLFKILQIIRLFNFLVSLLRVIRRGRALFSCEAFPLCNNVKKRFKGVFFGSITLKKTFVAFQQVFSAECFFSSHTHIWVGPCHNWQFISFALTSLTIYFSVCSYSMMKSEFFWDYVISRWDGEFARLWEGKAGNEARLDIVVGR